MDEEGWREGSGRTSVGPVGRMRADQKLVVRRSRMPGGWSVRDGEGPSCCVLTAWTEDCGCRFPADGTTGGG